MVLDTRYVICEDCGESNKAGAQFCLFCGAYLEWQDSDTEAADEVTQQLPPVASTATPTSSKPPTPPAAPPSAAPAAAPQTTGLTPVGRAVPAEPAAPAARPAPQPAAQASQPARPVHQSTPVDTTPDEPTARAPRTCPRCGRTIDPKLRFCAHCGEQFVKPGADAPVSRPTQKHETWWTRLWNSKDRAARRAYRRSLPPLYRWRRVIVTMLALVLVGSGLTWVARSSPKAFFKARYNDLTGQLVSVPDVQATTIPPDASAADSKPGNLVDNNARPWKMAWTATTQGSPCGSTQAAPVIQLSFPETRIKEIDMRAGLQKKNPNRELEFRPKKIWVAYGDHCEDIDLLDIEHQEHIKLDTKRKVTSIRIGVQTAFPDDPPEGIHELMSFTEITLMSRPPVN